jgi:hypothetical protein
MNIYANKKQRYYCAETHVKKNYNYVINCIKPGIYTDTDTYSDSANAPLLEWIGITELNLT